MNISYPECPGLHRSPAYSQVVVVPPGARTIYISGQNATDESGNIVGAGDMRTQARQIFRNLGAALSAAGADFQHIVQWKIYIVAGHRAEEGFEVFQEVWGNRPNPPAVTVLFVSALANPAYLMEIEAVAVAP